MDMLAHDATTWRTEFAVRSRPLATRWRRQRLAYRALSSLPVPLFGSLLVLLVLRFTLIDLVSGWMLLLAPPLLWALGLLVSYLLDRPPLFTVAKQIDAHFELDERMASAWELSTGVATNASPRMIARLRLDALSVLQGLVEEVRHAFPVDPRTRRNSLIASAVLAALFVAVAFVPSPVDADRQAQAVLRGTIIGAADKLNRLKIEAVDKPELDPNEASTLQDTLAAAESSLRDHDTDRAAAVASLSQAEDTIRGLLPDNLAQVSAGRNAAASALRSASVAAGGLAPDDSGLLGAAQSAETLDALLGELNQQQTFAAAGNLDRASDAIKDSDPELSKLLVDAATALRDDRLNDADKDLQKIAEGFRQLADRQSAQDFLQDTLDEIGSSKQQIAETGQPATAEEGAGQANSNRGLGVVKGNGEGAGGAQTTTQPDSGDGADSQGQPGANAGTGTGDNNGTSASGDVQRNPGNGAANNGPRNGDPAQPGDPNPTGNGSGGLGDPNKVGADSGTGDFEPVYVPDEAAAQPSASGPTGTVSGTAGDSGSDRPAGETVGAGVKNDAKVPYNQVIGQYSDSAAESLDRSALPDDARNYVRDYFNSLQR